MADPRAFVCGHPIAHSRSPLIHGFWLKELGISGSYEAVDVAPDGFAAFMGQIARRGYAGGNVTIPHKEAAFAAVARHGAAAAAIGAVNTLWYEQGALHGDNTDAYGFAANLDEYAPDWRGRGVAVVLGAGGAARAVIHALATTGYRDIRVVNRTLERATALRERFGAAVAAHAWHDLPKVLDGADFVANTTSLGMQGAEAAEWRLEPLPGHAIATDIVYAPLETPFLAAARRHGLKTVDGLGMLLHQAAPGFERWFGQRPRVTQTLRDLVVADIGTRK